MTVKFGRTGQAVGQIRSRMKGFLSLRLQRVVNGRTKRILIDGSEFEFWSPNSLTDYRLRTVSSKEPETIRWLKTMGPGDVLWDVGANIGLYSVFSAKRGVKVVAAEPSVANIAALTTNVRLNQVSAVVLVLSIPLSNRVGSGFFNEVSDVISSSGGQFGIDPVECASQSTLMPTMSIDFLVHSLGLPSPDFLKIDVDGNETEILGGCLGVLASVRSILVEVSESTERGKAGCPEELLTSLGFGLLEEGRRNQIWGNLRNT
jgi:FkbM family methyltransferase